MAMQCQPSQRKPIPESSVLTWGGDSRGVRWLWKMAVLAVIVCRGHVVSAEDRSIFALVSSDAAAVLEVPHAKATWETVQNSRLADRITESALAKRLLSGEGMAKWLAVENFVKSLTGQTLSDQALAACSETLVVALHTPAPENPLSEFRGVLIARASDPAAIGKFLETWRRLDSKLTDETREHRGIKYVCRSPHKGGRVLAGEDVPFFVQLGRDIAISHDEALLRQTIDRHLAATDGAEPNSGKTAATLGDSPMFLGAHQNRDSRGIAFLYVNSVPWNRFLNAAAEQDQDAKPLRDVARVASFAVLELIWDEGLALTVKVELLRDQLPAWWGEFARSSHVPPMSSSPAHDHWSRRLPAEAIVAMGGGLDVRPLISIWMQSEPDTKSNDFLKGRRAMLSVLLGHDFFDEVLPRLAQHWNVVLTTVEKESSQRSATTSPMALPIDVTADANWTDNNETKEPTEERASFTSGLVNAIQFGLNLGSVALVTKNDPPSVSPRISVDSVENDKLLSLTAAAPWNLSALVTGTGLIVGNSKSTVMKRRSERIERTSRLVSKRLADHERRFFSRTSQLLWVDSVRLRAFLSDHGVWLTERLAGASHEPADRVAKRLSHVADALKVIDAAHIGLWIEETRLSGSISLAIDSKPAE